MIFGNLTGSLVIMRMISQASLKFHGREVKGQIKLRDKERRASGRLMLAFCSSTHRHSHIFKHQTDNYKPCWKLISFLFELSHIDSFFLIFIVFKSYYYSLNQLWSWVVVS